MPFGKLNGDGLFDTVVVIDDSVDDFTEVGVGVD